MPNSRSNFARAFTLLELIVVMMLIAAILAIATPSLISFSKGRRLGYASDQLLALARYARTQSITRGIDFRLNIDPAQRVYWLTMQNGPSFDTVQPDPSAAPGATHFDQVGNSFGTRFSLPDGVTVDFSALPQQDGQYVQFYPTGRCDPATVVLTDSNRQTVELGTLAASETWHVLSEDEIQQQASQQPPPPSLAR